MAADVTTIKFESKVTVFKLNDGSSLQDLSANIISMKFTGKFKESDGTTFGKNGYVPDLGQDISEFSVKFFWNQLTTTGVQTVVGAMFAAKATRAFELYPAGTTSGNTKISGSCCIPEYPIEAQVGDMQTVTVTFKVSNGTTWGTAT